MELWQEAKKKGLKCCKNSFWNVIRNPVFCGLIIVPEYQQEEEHYTKGTHEPIITEELFYTVQDVLDGRKKPHVKKAVREDFPLRNFLTCPRCGKQVTASASKGRTAYYHYYHCSSTCGWRFKAEVLHDAFIQELRKYKPRPAMIQLYKEVI